MTPARPSPSRPWIKVCGVRTAADVDLCARAGATHVGVNLWPHSPRRVSLPRAALLASAARAAGLAPVLLPPPGLPVDPGTSPGFAWVQTGGPLPPSAARLLRRAGLGIVESRPWNRDAAALPWGDVLLLDASGTGAPGGTGRPFPWGAAAAAPRPFVLAGGLTPHNVAGAVAEAAPWGVDAASGLESSPGVKDPGRVRDFCSAAREAFARLSDFPGGHGP